MSTTTKHTAEQLREMNPVELDVELTSLLSREILDECAPLTEDRNTFSFACDVYSSYYNLHQIEMSLSDEKRYKNTQNIAAIIYIEDEDGICYRQNYESVLELIKANMHGIPHETVYADA